MTHSKEGKQATVRTVGDVTRRDDEDRLKFSPVSPVTHHCHTSLDSG